jgi:hypothetical protein
VAAAGQDHPGLGWPLQGSVYIKGEDWIPYRPSNDPAPPFAEYASGHSTFSMAAAEMLTAFTGRGNFELKVTIPAGSSRVEPAHQEHELGPDQREDHRPATAGPGRGGGSGGSTVGLASPRGRGQPGVQVVLAGAAGPAKSPGRT